MAKTLESFLEQIEESGLLSSQKLEKVKEWATGENVDPKQVVKQILQHNWLSQLQIKMLWNGKLKDLILGQYVLIEKIGEGGMGEVYRAQHRRMERDVALKIIRPERLQHTETVKRFEREIQLAAQLTHENVVMAYDAVREGDRIYFAMEFVQGVTLAQKVKDQGALSILEASNYIRQTALGLQHAFERGLIHRDIKPSNLLINPHGVVKILDMGLARLNEQEDIEKSHLTKDGIVVGTPDFIAPEQARNSRDTDIRSDIYSLGCTFFWALTNQPPYPGGTPTEKLFRHAMDKTPLIHEVRPDLPLELSAIIAKMMAKNPAERYQTPEEVVQVLTPYCFSPRPEVEVLNQPSPITASQPYEESFQNPVENQFKIESMTDKVVVAPVRRAEKPPNRILWIGGSAALLMVVIIAILLMPKHSTEPVLEERFTNAADIKMVRISPGKFQMGSGEEDPDRQPSEMPAHEVEITYSFYMSQTEITQEQYLKLMGARPAQFRKLPDAQQRPIESITYGQAISFTDKLNLDKKNSPQFGWIYRLPTEAEWEFVCRTGLSKTDAANGVPTKEEAIYQSSQLPHPQIVGKTRANELGIYDLRGNVWEWVIDWYGEQYYQHAPTQNPFGPASGTKRIVRGGGYDSPASDCRPARRRAEFPDFKSPEIGFRVVYAPNRSQNESGKKP